MDNALIFKFADEDWEFEEIHKLNYETFVEEIPQHERNAEGRLVDKFHAENTYAICLSDGQLLGMMALRSQRPFSLDSKLKNLDAYLPQGRPPCEIRLLAVRKNKRNGQIFQGLMKMAAEYCTTRGFDVAVISGTTRQERLYRHMGFVPFGPLVGTSGALYQPMYLTAEAFFDSVSRLRKTEIRKEAGEIADSHEGALSAATPDTMVNFLPGPVGVHPDVMEAFRAEPISHRCDQFVEDLKDTKARLCRLTGARFAEIFQGSGTLANDVVATELSLDPGPGLILSNGEFGDRLVDHAERIGLTFERIRCEWGQAFDYAAVETHLGSHPGLQWLWFVHCETSTGILNDLPGLTTLCRRHNVKVCVDAISTVGIMPVDLGQVYLASCTSGKGIAGLPGIAVVFHNHEISEKGRKVPRYMDLAYYAGADGVPFTFSSNLLYAFHTALKRLQTDTRFETIRRLSRDLRDELRMRGFQTLAPDSMTSPAVTTVVLPPSVSSRSVGRAMEAKGCLISYNSEYLIRRNWVQVCLMGECSQAGLAQMVEQLSSLAGNKTPARPS